MNRFNLKTVKHEMENSAYEHMAFMLLVVLLAIVFSVSLIAPAFGAGLAGSAGQQFVKQTQQAEKLAQKPAPAVQSSVVNSGTSISPERPVLHITGKEEWRIRIFEAAVVNGPFVKLGEIAAPAGPMPAELWQQLENCDLWLAPQENGKPVNLTRPRLQQVMLASMGKDFAAMCLYPPSIMLQSGGKLMDAAAIHNYTVKTLTPLLATIPGEVELSDFRLPTTVFLAHNAQLFELEAPQKIAPGRLSLRYLVKELDGTVTRRVTGSVFIDAFAAVPCVLSPVNKGEILHPENITFVKKNLAHLRDDVWDGRGGPWQAQRAIGIDQPVFKADLGYIPTIKKGDRVRLVFSSGSVRLSAMVEALSDGVSGETIAVRNLQSKRQVYAVIYDANTVTAQSSSIQIGAGAQAERSPAFNTPQHTGTATVKEFSAITPAQGKRGTL